MGAEAGSSSGYARGAGRCQVRPPAQERPRTPKASPFADRSTGEASAAAAVRLEVVDLVEEPVPKRGRSSRPSTPEQRRPAEHPSGRPRLRTPDRAPPGRAVAVPIPAPPLLTTEEELEEVLASSSWAELAEITWAQGPPADIKKRWPQSVTLLVGGRRVECPALGKGASRCV